MPKQQSKLTVSEIAAFKKMSKTNAWWHVRKLWSPEERLNMFDHGVFMMNEAQSRKLMNRIDAVSDVKKQARGPKKKEDK